MSTIPCSRAAKNRRAPALLAVAVAFAAVLMSACQPKEGVQPPGGGGGGATTTTAPPTTTTAPPTTTTAPPTTTTAPPTTTTTTPPAARPLALKVSGKNFVDQDGKVVQLRGVNRSGTEYRCAQSSYSGFIHGDGGTEGTDLSYVPKMISAFKTWNKPGAPGNAINTVRIPLNEDCWLGINGAAPAYSGTAYQNFIKAEVNALIDAGMYPVLDLHWSAPGSYLATQQDVGPNTDHSVEFWRQVATMFGSKPSVVFDLFNEPRMWCYTTACQNNYTTAAQTAWACYRDGCAYQYSTNDWVNGRTSGTIQIAGTQQLVNTIRATGANNVILVEGLGYANSFDQWMAYRPNDPAKQIAASIHMYTSSGANVNNTAFLDGTMASGGLSDSYPILVGEFGEWLCNSATTGFTQATLDWADNHGYSYTAWGWDAGQGCNGPSLVTDNAGTASTYGAIVRSHLQRKQG